MLNDLYVKWLYLRELLGIPKEYPKKDPITEIAHLCSEVARQYKTHGIVEVDLLDHLEHRLWLFYQEKRNG